MQYAIVTFIVLCAVCAVVRRYAPSVWKTASAGLASVVKRLGWHALAERLSARQSAVPACASGCATCGGCESAARSPAGEYVVVIERLKRNG